MARIAQDLVEPSKVMDLPHVAPNHMESGTRRLLPYATVREDGVISAKQRFFPGQILYSKIRPYLRKAVAVDFVGVCSADVYPISPTVAVDRDYLLFWLASEDFKLIALPHQGRTLLPKINQNGLNGTPVPVPPLAEQRRIAKKLNALVTRLGSARAELDRFAHLAPRLHGAALAEQLEGVATRTVILGDVLEDVRYGTAKKCDYDGGRVPVLRIPNVQRGRIDISDLKSADFDQGELRKLSLREGDVAGPLVEVAHAGGHTVMQGCDYVRSPQRGPPRAKVHAPGRSSAESQRAQLTYQNETRCRRSRA